MGCLKKGLTSHQRHGSAILSQEPSWSSGHTRRVSGGARRLLPPPLRFFRPARAAPALLIAAGLVLLFGAGTAWAQEVISIVGGGAVTEGSTATFTVISTPAPASNLTVNLDVSQTGSFVASENIGDTTVTVPSTGLNAGSASFTVATVGNDTNDPTGSVTVEVETGTGYTVDPDLSDNTATVAVNDDDTPEVSIVGGGAVTEGSTATFTVTATLTPHSNLTVNLDVSQTGSFVASGNIGDTTVTVPSTGLNAGSASFTVATVGNDTNDPTGSVTVEVETGTGYTVDPDLSDNTATVAVNDDDTPEVSIVGGGAVTEGSTATFTVTATLTPHSNLTVNLDVSQSGSFVASENIGDTTVTVPSTGLNAGSASFTVATVGNDTNDPTGSVTVEVETGTGYTVDPDLSDNTATVAVNDDDTPEVSIVGGGAVTEGSTATYTVTATLTPHSNLTVNLDVSQSGSFVASGNIGDTTVTVPSTGLNAGSASFTVATVGNDTNDPTGSVTVEVETGTGYTVDPDLSDNTATVAVNDDDTPEVSIVGGGAVTEGSTATFTVTATLTPHSNLTVNLDVSQSGSFVASENIGDTTVTVPSTGLNAGSASFTVATVGNDTNDPTGSVTVEVETGTGYTVDPDLSDNTATVAVNDDDTPEVSIVGGGAVTEGSTATFTVTATLTPHSNLTVNLDVSQSGSFVASGNIGDTTVTVPSTGLNAGSASFTVATVGNDTNDPTGSVTVEVETGTGYTVDPDLSDNTATVAVNDDDTPEVSIVGGGAVTEGSTATFTVTATLTPHSNLTVNLDVSQSGSFVASENIGDTTVTVPSTGLNAGSASFTVATVGNDTNDPTGSVTVEVETGTGYTVDPDLSDNTATVAVNDDDTPEVSIVGGGAVTEGSTATFTVTATLTPHSNLTVNLDVSQSGSFVASENIGDTTVTVPSTGLNAGSASFTVATVGNDTNDPTGSVTVEVETGTGYTVDPDLSDNTATVAVNDDDTPEVSIVGGGAVTEGSTATFTVTASPTPLSDLTVNLTVSQSGSFVASENIGDTTVTVPSTGLGAGSASFTVATVGNDTNDPTGSVTVEVETGTGYTVDPDLSDNTATVAVNDDIAPDAPSRLLAYAADGAVTLSWNLPGGAAITDYEYQIDGEGEWISIGSARRIHTITGLTNGTVYAFRVRAVNRNGRSRASRRVTATPGVVLDLAHFANGTGILTEIVLVNVSPHPTRPALYFYDTQGNPIDPASLVDVTGDLVVAENGSLTVHTEMQPLSQLTISTHGRGELVSGSVRVVSGVPISGLARYSVPGVGVTGAGASLPVWDIVFPARRQEGGIRTAAALYNLQEEAMAVSCRLMSGGVVLEEVEIPLEANGQASWFIEEAFTMTDTSDFLGSVRCTVPASKRFTATVVEVDAAQGIFTTLPVASVDRTGGSGGETVLDFAHFANGTWITDLVFVNLSIQPSGPSISPFHEAILPQPSRHLFL